MQYILKKEDNTPAYLQLYRHLAADIVSGKIAAGEKLPSKRALADACGVSVITVEHAYALLADEGYILPRERSGYYALCDKKNGVPLSAERPAPPPPIPSDSKSDFPFSAFAKTIRQTLSRYGERILVESPPNGCPELRRAIAAHLFRTRGIAVSEEQIVIGAGAEYLYSLLLQLLGRKRLYAIESPSYHKIRAVYRANGIRFDELPLSADGIGSETLWKSRATVLHVTPCHSFPSNISASPAKRMEYIRFAEERGGYIIEDDYLSEFSLPSKPAPTLFSLSPNGRVIYLNTFSKTLSPAMRLGYIVLPPCMTALYREKLGFYACTVPVFDQYVLAEFIASGEFERHINRRRRAMKRDK